MKLRVRIRSQTFRLELEGEEPSLKELKEKIRLLLGEGGVSVDTPFYLSLNGSELLSDGGQTEDTVQKLSSCGVVSGDLICVLLPESEQTSIGSVKKQETTCSQRSERPPAPGASQDGASPSPPVAVRWEPMLCSEAEEGHAPLALELLYVGARATCPSDALVVVGHLLMLETGFTQQGVELQPGEMPPNWRSSGGVYKLSYCHPLCDGSQAMVVAVRMGTVLVMNATLQVNAATASVCRLALKTDSYVSEAWPGSSAAAAFKDLRKLSRLFKDQLAYPLIAAARQALCLPVVFGLAALPPELLLRVLRVLDVQSVSCVSAVCRRLRSAAADRSLWRHLYRRDFGDGAGGGDVDWKELYQRSFTLRREATRRFLRPQVLLPPVDIVPFHPPVDIIPFQPSIPGIIGGEYDQRPDVPFGPLPRPRYDPIGPFPESRRRPAPSFSRPPGGRPADVRRGFI